MTEFEWLASTDPGRMLHWITCAGPSGYGQDDLKRWRNRPSDRKLRLFACACCRLVWHLLTDDVPCPECVDGQTWSDPFAGEKKGVLKQCPGCKGSGRANRSRRAVEVAERYADGLATVDELGQADHGVDQALRWDLDDDHAAAMVAAMWVCHEKLGPRAWEAILAHTGSPATQADLLRDVVGNPFRPVRLLHAPDCPSWAGPKTRSECECQCPWLTPNVLALARAAYEERGPRLCSVCEGKWGYAADTQPACRVCDTLDGRMDNGTLDPARLAVLSDALEEAGCTDADLLMHLRGRFRCPEHGGEWCLLRGPHVRGCWALDLLLGNE